MDVIYTDECKNELGVLHDFSIDFDCDGSKDFQIDVAISNNVLKPKYFWFIPGTEYGGRVDDITAKTETNTLLYSGLNFRGLLFSRIIEPPTGEDYKFASGRLDDILKELIQAANYDLLFEVEEDDTDITSFKFNRYISLYEGIMLLLASIGRVITLTCTEDNMVVIGSKVPTDYSSDVEYCEDNIDFVIKKTYSNVNHLICLGKGELKDRTVIHLYADADGNISETQTITGTDEVQAIYENSGVDSVEELKEEGKKKLEDMNKLDTFEVTIPEDKELSIGDIIGGHESITDTYVIQAITNCIATITDERIVQRYQVGGAVANTGSNKVVSNNSTITNVTIQNVASQVVNTVERVVNTVKEVQVVNTKVEQLYEQTVFTNIDEYEAMTEHKKDTIYFVSTKVPKKYYMIKNGALSFEPTYIGLVEDEYDRTAFMQENQNNNVYFTTTDAYGNKNKYWGMIAFKIPAIYRNCKVVLEISDVSWGDSSQSSTYADDNRHFSLFAGYKATYNGGYTEDKVGMHCIYEWEEKPDPETAYVLEVELSNTITEEQDFYVGFEWIMNNCNVKNLYIVGMVE